MRDICGRTITYLRVSLTQRCNCRCTYCMPAGPQTGLAPELSWDELYTIVAALVTRGITKVRLTGGEPLVREGVVDFVRRLNELREAGLSELCLTTNATRLADLAAPLKEAGLDRLNVSLDTLDPARYAELTRTGRLEDALEGLAAAREAGFTGTKLNSVLFGQTAHEDVPALYAFALDQGYDLRFIELMPIGEAAAFPRESFMPASEVLTLLPQLEPLSSAGDRADAQADSDKNVQPDDGSNVRFGCDTNAKVDDDKNVQVGRNTNVRPGGVAELYTAPELEARGITVGLIRPLSHAFCGSCNRLRLTSDGRLKPCLHAALEINVAGRSGAALEEALDLALAKKPERHFLAPDKPSLAARTMNQIGG